MPKGRNAKLLSVMPPGVGVESESKILKSVNSCKREKVKSLGSELMNDEEICKGIKIGRATQGLII